MFIRRMLGTLAFFASFSALLLMTNATPRVHASAEPQTETSLLPAAPAAAYKLDHFWCYNTTSTFVNEQVQLQDQFTTALVAANVGAPEYFCNAVKKKHGDKIYNIVDPNAHLILYKIGSPTQKLLEVEVNNQFGTQRLRVFAPAWHLAVPTTLVGVPPPNSLDHFKCYKVKGSTPQAVVNLKDGLTSAKNRTVGKPVLLCNPTVKVHNNQTTPIRHPKAHLVCYNVTPKQYTNIVNTLNQFRGEPLTVQLPSMLCAPSTKKILD